MSAFDAAVEAAHRAAYESEYGWPMGKNIEVSTVHDAALRAALTAALPVLLDGLDREALVETCRTGGRPYTDLGRERAGQVADAVIAHLRAEFGESGR